MVMGMANLAMATGNIGFSGCGRQPAARPEQRAGLLRHGLVPARTRRVTGRWPTMPFVATFENRLGRHARRMNRDSASPTCSTAAVARRRSRACTSRARTSPSPTPTPKHVEAALEQHGMRRGARPVPQRDAKFAHVFLPGTVLPREDGTFINAERRINRVRPVMKPRQGKAEWRITQELAQALGLPEMHFESASRDHGRDRRLTPDVQQA